MEQNRYAPPKARVSTADAPPEAEQLASRGQRFANMLIDVIGYLVLSMVIGVVAAFVYPPLLETSGPLGDWLFGVFVASAYYLPLEALFGRTLGKLVTRTYVVSASGDPATFRQLLGRTLARFIPFEPFSFFTRDAIGWHDSLSGTRVVRRSRS